MNFVENLVDGNRLLPVLLQDLDSATRSIHITIFLFFDDPIGEEISGVLPSCTRPSTSVCFSPLDAASGLPYLDRW
jgi:hypothetical protein